MWISEPHEVDAPSSYHHIIDEAHNFLFTVILFVQGMMDYDFSLQIYKLSNDFNLSVVIHEWF